MFWLQPGSLNIETTENSSLQRPVGAGISNYPFALKSLPGKIQEFYMLNVSFYLFTVASFSQQVYYISISKTEIKDEYLWSELII